MLTLGIETSCDESSVAVVRDGRDMLSNIILSQVEHDRYGGVVPEIASRAHVKTIIPILREAVREAQIRLNDIELVAATRGPGLVGPLLIGLTFAKGFAFSRGIPFVAVNHLEGHIAANLLVHPDLERHHVALIVSGGHTVLIEVNGFGGFRVHGQTVDDAAGEAFDKIAKLLGLGYPGGARLDRLARAGRPDFVRFPRAVARSGDYRFSYSGLKTAVAIYLEKLRPAQIEEQKADIAASFQEAAVTVLTEKTVHLAKHCRCRDVAISGGVAANSRLREMLCDRLQESGRRLFFPPVELCTDNAAMIASAGFFRYKLDGPSDLAVNAEPYLSLSE